MTIINGTNITKDFGGNLLFKDISFQINDNDKIGLIGPNGAGKTTLFKILLGKELPTSGTVAVSSRLSIGYMEQHTCTDFSKTLYEEALTAFSDLIKIEQELSLIANKIDSGDTSTSILERQALLQQQFEYNNGLTFRSRLRSALIGLGFDEADLVKPVSALSGGQRSKIALAKLLTVKHDMLLLDEPTNHLDIKSINWLEDFLKNFNGAYIVISHDRFFLDKVTNKTYQIASKKLFTGNGNYTYFMEQREQDKEIIRRHYENDLKEIKRLEDMITELRSWNKEKSIKTAESKEKMLEKLKDALVIPEKEPPEIRFNLEYNVETGYDVLKIKDLEMEFGNQSLFNNVTFNIYKNERVFLLGDNGCGKTTLFKILMGEFRARSGSVFKGSNIKTGYYDQTQNKLHDNKQVIDEIWDDYNYLTETTIRNYLAAFLFKSDDVFKQVGMLSGGEKARISILKLMLSKANVLLLDEPTNHLDIYSKEALEKALLGYGGTLFIISHDRYFINKMATRILYMNNGGVTSYDGNYDYFISKSSEVKTNPWDESDNEDKNSHSDNTKPITERNDYQKNKVAQSEIRKMKASLRRIEGEIEKSEQEIAEAESLINRPDIACDYKKLLEATSKLDELRNQGNLLIDEWSKLSEKLESIN